MPSGGFDSLRLSSNLATIYKNVAAVYYFIFQTEAWLVHGCLRQLKSSIPEFRPEPYLSPDEPVSQPTAKDIHQYPSLKIRVNTSLNK